MDRATSVGTRAGLARHATTPAAEKAPELLSPTQIAAIRAHNSLDDRSVLTQVEALVRAVSNLSPSARRQFSAQLTSLLGPETSLDGNHFLCRQLALIGGEDDAVAISALLRDPKTCDMARYALEALPGEKVNVALIGALDVGDASSKVGILNSLGNRRAKSARQTLETLSREPDHDIAEAARVALSKIQTGH